MSQKYIRSIFSKNYFIPLKLSVLFVLIFLIWFGCGNDPSKSIAESSWSGEPVVETKYGKVEAFEDESETWVWKAIPYAKPPVGELRWRAPQEPEFWEGVRAESNFCEVCSHYNQNTQFIGSEDCLYLNIWRPRSENIGLPVYFWIHGGGNSIGTAATEMYYGNNLAQKADMVVVSINYRLGPFGWFTHPALRSGNPGDEYHDSGNYGTLDIIQALKWAKGNITAFGGDPDNITIAGESAGAVNVLTLINSLAAKGLFHRAVSQSGLVRSSTVKDGDAASRRVLEKLLLNDGKAGNEKEAVIFSEKMSDSEVADYLRLKSAEEILACYETGAFGMLNSFIYNYADGAVIPENGFETFFDGSYVNKVPLLIGSNKEEMKLFMFSDSYFQGKENLYQAVADYRSDIWKVNGVDDIARKLSQHPDQPDVFVYQFLWGAGGDKGKSVISKPLGFKLGACHVMEIPFFFANESFIGPMGGMIFTEENRPGRDNLSNAMIAYLAGFARTGNPNSPDSNLPVWDAWTNEIQGPKSLLLDADLEKALIKMNSEELTAEKVQTGLDKLQEPLRTQVKDYLAGRR